MAKKVFIGLLILISVFAFAACGDGQKENQQQQNQQGENPPVIQKTEFSVYIRNLDFSAVGETELKYNGESIGSFSGGTASISVAASNAQEVAGKLTANKNSVVYTEYVSAGVEKLTLVLLPEGKSVGEVAFSIAGKVVEHPQGEDALPVATTLKVNGNIALTLSAEQRNFGLELLPIGCTVTAESEGYTFVNISGSPYNDFEFSAEDVAEASSEDIYLNGQKSTIKKIGGVTFRGLADEE